MKLSVFTTTTNAALRGDLLYPAMECYEALCDELVAVDGSEGTLYDEGLYENGSKHTIFQHHPWPQEFSWEFIGQQFQRGYEASMGDWVIHADLDFIFHERDYNAIRHALKYHDDAPALSFWKYQFILPDRYNLKSRLVIAVNKGKYGDRIKFDSGRDLCQPSLDGKELNPNELPEARIPFYNYEKLLKTENQIRDDVGRMARAWERHFGDFKLGGPEDDSAYEKWLKMTVGRFNGRSAERIALDDHPKVMQETIERLRPSQWGFNGFGYLPKNDYVGGDA